jgi:hypothetical protein
MNQHTSGSNPSNNAITEDIFKEAMKEVCYLIGKSRPDKNQLALFFKKVKNRDARDFIKACKSEMLLREFSQRRNLCWPTLFLAMNNAQSDRLEIENKLLKQRETFPADIPPEIRAQIDAILGHSRGAGQ